MITESVIKKIAPTANKAFLKPMVAAMVDVLPAYGINTPLRVAHFLAQAAHESAGFKTMTEYASGSAYEGRKDLGNTKKGDGKRYKGRGIFQLTGRANYIKIGEKLGLPLEANPTLAAEPRNAVLIACEYWKSRKLNAPADKDDILTITKRINGGYNGLDDRRRYLSRAKHALKSIVQPLLSPEVSEPAPEREASVAAPNAAETAITPQSGELLIKALQTELKAKGYYDGAIDGVWADESLTDDAVALLQKRNGMEIGPDAIRLSEVRAAKPYVVATRVDATVETLKERGDPETTFFGRVKAGAKWFLGVLGLGGASAGVEKASDQPASALLDKASDALSLWERIQLLVAPMANLFWAILHWIWIPALLAILAAWWWSRRAEQKRLAAFKAGAP
jgi:predicted chitinase